MKRLIERVEIDNFNRKTRVDIITPEFDTLDYVNDKIVAYAEAWRKEANMVLHRSGQSVIFYPNYRVEFTRIPAPHPNY